MLARWARWSRIAGREGYISRRRARWPILGMLGTLVRQEGWLSRQRASAHHLSWTVTDHLSHTILRTPLCHTSSLTTSSFTHTQLCHTPSFLHLPLCFPSFPVPATTFLAHYWKKLTCGVIRSFNLLTSCIYR